MGLNIEQKKYIKSSITMNVVIFIIINLLFYSTYESQIDEMVLAVLCGTVGFRTAYVLYSNVVLGKIWTILLSFFPRINWYMISLTVLVFIALSAISYIAMKRLNNRIGIILSFVFVVFIGYECYILPGSMKTSAVLIVAMFLVFVDGIELYLDRGEGRTITNKMRTGIIVFLAISASLISFTTFLISLINGLVCLGIYGIFKFRKNGLKGSKEEIVKKALIRYTVSLTAGIMAVVLFFLAVDCVSYHVTGQENALKYRSAILHMYGFGMGEYDESYQEEYGIDITEYTTIKSGSFGVTSEEGWRILDKLSKERKLSFISFLTYFRTIPIMLFKYRIFYLFIIMLFLLFFTKTERKAELIWVETGLLLFDFLIAYLFNVCWTNDIIFILILPILLPLLLFLKNTEEREYQYLWVYLTVLGIVLYSKFSPEMVSHVSNEDMTAKFADLSNDSINLIDLNAYFNEFSAWKTYDANILQSENLKISNGAYALFDGFADKIIRETPSDETYYEWVFNPKGIDIWKLVFED